MFSRNGNPVIIFGDHTRHLKYIEEDFVAGADGTKIIVSSGNMLMKYLFYILNKIVDSSELPNLGYNRHFVKLKEIAIPIPPLEIQNEIVEILEQFDILVNDIAKGLPAEITLRRKQYKFYREQLLNFNNFKD